MSFQGDITSLSLGDLVQNLAANRKSGKLKVTSGEREWSIFFRSGKVLSHAEEQGLSIGEWLVEKEIITRPQLEEAMRRHRRAKKKTLGEILRDLGLLDLEEYRSYFANLVQETLYEVLSYQEGTFEFLEGEVEEEDLALREAAGLGIEHAAQSLVMEAARRADDWQKIRRHIPSENEIYIVAPGGRERLSAEAADECARDAIQLLDGTRTLRQVVARLPYSRFDACRALAELIAEKKARYVDGSMVKQFTKGNEDPRQVIACLKAILEREPNNRQLLERLAELHERVGQRDEAATSRKLLAISFLDDGELKSAEKCLRKSLDLNPRDIGTWGKLLDAVGRQGDSDRFLQFAAEFAAHFKKLGLLEIVRDHLVEMVKRFPEHLEFQLELAETRYALGEEKGGIDALHALGLECLRKHRLDEAEAIFARILRYERDNAKARQMLEKIRSGKIARRRALRRRLARGALFGLLLAAAVAFVAYEMKVRGELFRITREVYAESLLERGLHDEAIARLRALRERHPYSFGAREAELLLGALQGRRTQASGSAPERREAGPPPPEPPPGHGHGK
jgi:tetratricopeptide (TPR) repeat protein